jgi:DNA-binding winged helix-turn-helix (wHTH) protein/Tfp pilus assembly protein PilF/TolB-like protein
VLKLADLADRADFSLGSLRVSPARRKIEGPTGNIHVEPLIMQVFVLLVEAKGEVVTRSRLFDECWGGVNVGDYSLNRAITMVRRIATQTAPGAFEIENIPRTGYRLVTNGRLVPEPAKVSRSRTVIGGGILLALVSAALLIALLTPDRATPTDNPPPSLVAVLPFESHGGAPAYLAETLWDDTRAAISQAGAVRVLGRATTEAAGRGHLSPEQYRRRFGVDYLLEGTLRRDADQALVYVSLTRTVDGLAVWEDSFRSRLGDRASLEGAIAGGIEGKLRGRLAPGGGKRASQITTTPEVYALYSQARALLYLRERKQAQRAEALLRQAVALDPNFAPGWSSLASAIYLSGEGPVFQSSERTEALKAIRQALALAPNLAEAHATLANVFLANSPAAERELRRAVALDPSYAEAWNWLGNLLHANYRYREAVSAFERALEIDPLWEPPVRNLVWAANSAGNRAAIDRMFELLKRVGASREAIVVARAEDFLDRGDYSGSYQTLMQLGRDAQGQPAEVAIQGTADVFMLVGYPERAAQLHGLPDWFGAMVRSERLPPSTLNGKPITPAEFWSTIFFAPFASRAMVNLGKDAELVRIYRARFGTADGFLSTFQSADSMAYLAPTLSVALKSEGYSHEADYILAGAAKAAEGGMKASPKSFQPIADLAIIRAAQGEREQAIRLLELAVTRGWRPDSGRQSLDLAIEPSYRNLRGDPRFEAVRSRVLHNIARERKELESLGVR